LKVKLFMLEILS